jgi:hypothetical protein
MKRNLKYLKSGLKQATLCLLAVSAMAVIMPALVSAAVEYRPSAVRQFRQQIPRSFKMARSMAMRRDRDGMRA